MLLTNDEKSKKIRENFRQRFMEKRNSDWFYTLPLEEDRKNIFGITEEAIKKEAVPQVLPKEISGIHPRELKGAEKRMMMEEEMRKLREENNLLWEAIVKLLKLI